MRPVIEIRGAGKRYHKLEEHRTLLRALMPIAGERRHEFWALRDIDAEVGPAETLGVLGQNGAGKTTLLRLLAGVTSPTTGSVRVEGRIGPLISLGVGFHNEMSGRENVLVNGMLLGLTAKQVAARFDQIVAFAELEDFIDTPVKFYSSGMFMRLGFAVMAHTDPTILLVDEVLAVGDARFQLKCFDRLRALRDQGAAVVMVSHSMHMIRQICDRAIVLRHGRLVFAGDIEGAIDVHERSVIAGSMKHSGGAVDIVERGFVGHAQDHYRAAYDEPIHLRVRLRFNQAVADPVLTVGAITSTGMFAGFDTTLVGDSWRTFHAGEEATVEITFPARFGPGSYRLVVDVKNRTGAQRLARSDDLLLVLPERSAVTGITDVRAHIEVGDLTPQALRHP
jgi:ABC-type polysaccharide/polyol phosphate transport system ATPase subunit